MWITDVRRVESRGIVCFSHFVSLIFWHPLTYLLLVEKKHLLLAIYIGIFLDEQRFRMLSDKNLKVPHMWFGPLQHWNSIIRYFAHILYTFPCKICTANNILHWSQRALALDYHVSHIHLALQNCSHLFEKLRESLPFQNSVFNATGFIYWTLTTSDLTWRPWFLHNM